jgi:3-dehydroquinate synthase
MAVSRKFKGIPRRVVCVIKDTSVTSLHGHPDEFSDLCPMQCWDSPFGPVYVGEDALSELDAWLAQHRASYTSVGILTDSHVHEACLPRMLAELESLGTSFVLEIDPGEESKSVDILQQLWLALLENGADRKTLLISLGGGVVTDLGGFLASTYMRGIDHIALPTSLLGMVDASLGGKTGIDVGGYKNLAGSFAVSQGIYVWPPALDSLPEEHWRAGWAECLKLWAEACAIKDWLQVAALLPTLMAVKMHHVAEDPFEQGAKRKALNLGHTMGHALEAALGPSCLHGDAVAAGLWMESFLSESMGISSPSDAQKLRNAVDQWWPETLAPPPDVTKRLVGDKKNQSGQIILALPTSPGNPVALVPVPLSAIKNAFEAYAAHSTSSF